MSDPGFCTVVAQLADPKFPNEIRYSFKNQYLKKKLQKNIYSLRDLQCSKAKQKKQLFI